MGTLLKGYRVLDLTDIKGFFCGKILADLGAEVIKVEPPGGELTRMTGPFYHDVPDPERSLCWFAYNANKKGITLNIKAMEGQKIFTRLCSNADIIIESFPLGYMDDLGLGYNELAKTNPKIIMTSITPFGASPGPYREFKVSSFVLGAMGGPMGVTGTPDRSPVQVGAPFQAFLIGSAHAAVGTMIALYHRELTGEGQHVDASIYESQIIANANALLFWDMERTNLKRAGYYRYVGRAGSVYQKQVFPCTDGFMSYATYGGAAGAASNSALVEWANREGIHDDFVDGIDWNAYDMATVTQEQSDRITGLFEKLFVRHTKVELYEEAVRLGIQLFPVSALDDLLKDKQLAAREFWVSAEYPELSGVHFVYPGAFVKQSVTSAPLLRHAPSVGEHNKEIYMEELGFSQERLDTLNQQGII